MKLISLNDYPQWKSVFCNLSNRVLSDADKPYAIKPENVDKILDLKFPVPSEAFFLEDLTGEFFGRIFVQGSLLNPEVGHWGLFCLSSQPKHKAGFIQLWPEIESWFKTFGMKKIIGPYLYTTYFPYRLRSDDLPERYSWEPNQPSVDLEVFKAVGFNTHETYFSNIIDGYGVFETKGTRELEEAQKLGFKFREISKEAMDEDIKILYELSMKTFTDNYLFVPIPFELFKSIYVPSFQGLDLRMSCIVEDPQGKPVGFNFTFIMDDQIVIKSVCVLNEYRGKGLLNATFRWSMLQAMKLYPQVKKVATALIHEDNIATKNVANQSLDRKRHEYILLSKDIP